MVQIRKSIFETNSSSTHSITVSRDNQKYLESLPSELNFGGQSFGWGWECYTDTQSKANYLYTAAMLKYKDNLDKIKECQNRIKEVLKKWNIKVTFDDIALVWNGNWKYTHLDINGEQEYIDHLEEKDWIVENLLQNEDKLMTYLFSPLSYIATGNDNEDNYDLEYPSLGDEVLLDSSL